MPTYMCRWPNGDVSFVVAADKEEAASIGRLDEFGPVEDWMLTPVPDFFMMDFRLKEDGSLELEQIGEELSEFIYERAYPVLNRVFIEHPGAEENTDVYVQAVKDAVVMERQRLLTKTGRPEPSNGGDPVVGQ
jgi:hypothetical protein